MDNFVLQQKNVPTRKVFDFHSLFLSELLDSLAEMINCGNDFFFIYSI